MKIYDYYDEYALSSTLFTIISIICILALAFQIVCLIKSFYKAYTSKEALLLLCSIVITLVLTLFISCKAICLIKFDIACKTDNYESVDGQMQIISVERDDYRDVQQYDITFSVNGIVFDHINSFSEVQKEQFSQADGKRVKVSYAYVGNKLVIYQIVTYIDG